MHHRTATVLKAILSCVLFTILLMGFSRLITFIPAKYERFAYGIIGTFAALISTWVFLKIDKRSFSSIGLTTDKFTTRRFFIGLVIGITLSSFMILSLVYFANLQFERTTNNNIIGFFIWTLALLPLALMEEIAFRSYPFMILKKATGVRFTQILIAILFALYHVAGGQSVASSFLGPGTWSFVFGLAVIMTNGISVATGLHYGANLVLASVGQKKEFESIWTINIPASVSSQSTQYIETLGTVIQLCMFLATIGLMELHLRRKGRSTPENKGASARIL